MEISEAQQSPQESHCRFITELPVGLTHGGKDGTGSSSNEKIKRTRELCVWKNEEPSGDGTRLQSQCSGGREASLVYTVRFRPTRDIQ